MAICETCGDKFTPSKESPGCPRCEGAAQGSAPAPARSARPRPTSTAPAARAGAAKPAAAKPALKAAAAKPARARRAEPEPEEEVEERAIHHKAPEGLLDQSAKIGLIAAGGLAVIVLIAVVVVSNKRAAEAARVEAYENEVKNLYTELTALNIEDETQAKRLLQLAKDKEGRWQDHELAAQIRMLVVRAGTSLETGKERRAVLGTFTQIEKALADPSQLSPETLKEMRRSLVEIESKITLGGEEYIKRYGDAVGIADKAYVTRLVDGAKEGGANPRTALQQTQTAEDEIRKMLDTAITEKKAELQTFYTDIYKRAIEQSDQLAATLFTEKAIADLPWADMLSGEQLKHWNPSSVKGFSSDPQEGNLRLVGPDADAGRQAVISIGDREQWRNFVLDLEFTVEKGSFDLFMRLGRAPNANTVSLAFVTEGENSSINAAKTYHVTIRVIGSKLSLRWADDDDGDLFKSPKDIDLSWAKTRKGAIGLLVPSNTRLKITTFKVRDLR
ncbi:MAG: hypothetical protein EXS08_16190 [Planctomycetes bacterium]|nr:hypothetical protein [Planctomycetota bacterium]